MTFTAAIASGAAVDHLDRLLRKPRPGRATSIVRHGRLAVAYVDSSPWVKTHDDGEVLAVVDGRIHGLRPGVRDPALHAVERYRAEAGGMARGLLGDFVIIVLDRRSESMLVARDPLGVRPWYLASSNGDPIGASDMATLVALPGVDTAIDEATVIEYLAAVTQSRGPTIYRGVTTLGPGHTWLVAHGRGRTFAHHQWRLEPDTNISWDDAAARCRDVLGQVVKDRLDVSGSSTADLSGGLDSSIVVGTMAQLGADGLLAGRLVFEGPEADERRYSDAVADHWGIPLVSTPPWVGTSEGCLELTRTLRRPVPDPHFTMFTTLHEALLERGRLDSLTGSGGDDAFAATRIGGRVVSAVQLRQWSIIRQIAGATVQRPRQAWPQLIRPTLHHLAPWRGERPPNWITDRAARSAGLHDLFRRRPQRVTGIHAIDDRIDNLTNGHEAALFELRALVADRIGRRDSHPYLDPRLIEVTYGLDPWWPTVDHHNRALQAYAFRDRLPDQVAERRTKAGFAEAFWPGILGEQTLREVQGGPLMDLGWLKTEGLATLIERAEKGTPAAAIPLSRCVAVDRWLRVL
jgi:asparagine synthetase B (glutamine-hydrolysing)